MLAKQWDEAAQDALDRMRRAHQRGSGCYLTAEMIQSLALTSIGEVWSDERPKLQTRMNTLCRLRAALAKEALTNCPAIRAVAGRNCACPTASV